jgi:hypothetical protein
MVIPWPNFGPCDHLPRDQNPIPKARCISRLRDFRRQAFQLLVLGIAEVSNPEMAQCVTAAPLPRHVAFCDLQYQAPHLLVIGMAEMPNPELPKCRTPSKFLLHGTSCFTISGFLTPRYPTPCPRNFRKAKPQTAEMYDRNPTPTIHRFWDFGVSNAEVPGFLSSGWSKSRIPKCRNG